jgi:hypothetical protein
MNELALDAIMTACILAVALLMSMGFAVMGEPSSLWLWRDMFGVL